MECVTLLEGVCPLNIKTVSPLCALCPFLGLASLALPLVSVVGRMGDPWCELAPASSELAHYTSEAR